ncbi:MAG TPA: ATP synthase subunit I [Candidatus Acidoferrales bacterium]|jgi:peptidoglycan biosynthesis protein MviN/MurJ (putative lipid II flippase)|nr:ATP synthase subunit I [Candidatus Acidoferrales bacterium]
METQPRSREWYARAERRIASLTLIFGIVAGTATAAVGYPKWGVGIAVGASLAWLNFRWFEQGVTAVVRVAQAQAGTPKPRISMWVWAKMFGRYGVIGVLLYTTWALWKVPVVAMLAGLCALGAAVMAESIYEIIGRAN